MIDNSKEYILCSAIRRLKEKSGESYHLGMNDIHFVELGYRHHDIFARFKGELKERSQGFYTSYGRFVDRETAAKLAFECGQITAEKKILFSEDIY